MNCHIISLGAGEYDTSISLLIDSEEEHIVLMADLVRETRSDKVYLK